MSRCAVFGRVTAIGLASNECRWEHALCQIICGLEALDKQETQEVRPVLAQAFGKASVIRIGEAPGGGDQAIQALFKILNP